MPDDKACELIKLYERRKGDRSVFESHWQQCANYMQPNRNDYIAEKSAGQKRMTYVFDSHPIWAREQFAAGCHSFLTSDTLQWFGLRVEDDRIDRMQDVRVWLEIASTALYAVFNSPRYNFASQSGEYYDDLGTIGSACMAVLENRDKMPLFSTRHMKECVWGENEEDRVGECFRMWQWTAGQAFKQWGKAAGESVVKAVNDKTPDRKFSFLHCVRPRQNRDTGRADKMNMAFESVYIAMADQTVISESGFAEFAYLCARDGKITGETYGRGRGMTALPDVKMLNEAVKLVMKAAQKVIDPPLDLPDDTYILAVRTTPGSLNYRRPNMRPDDGIRPIETKGNIPLGHELIERLYNAIDKVFFVDLLRMPSDPSDPASEGKGSTATYWMQRREKEMMALSPFVARMKAEFLGGLIDRTFAMLWRKSRAMKFGPGSPFPPPPSALSGQKLRVDYVSPLAIAQKSSELDAIGRLLDMQLRLKQIDPQCPMILDAEWIMRRTGRDINAPAEALRTAEDLQAEAQAKQEAEQAMQNHAALANIAGAAKDGTAALANLQGAAANGNEQQGAA